MRILSTFSRSHALALLIAAAVLALSSLAVIRARTGSEPAAAGSATSPTKLAAPASLLAPSAAPPATDQKRMGALIVKLRRTGFEPSEVTRTRGPFLLAFDNHTDADEIVLQLKQETGNKLREVRMPRGNARWRQMLDLHPGRYVLAVADHPEWVCLITITAR